MEKNKFLQLCCLILLLSNLLLVIWIWKSKSKRGEGPRREIIERLHFDDAQIKQYDLLIKEHRASIRMLDDQMDSIKSILYAGLTKAVDESVQHACIEALGSKAKEIERVHYKHFLSIGSLCKKEQLGYFEDLSSDFTTLFHHKPKMK
jgi:hypothetical protein